MILVLLSSIALVYGVLVDQKVAILRALRRHLDASVDVIHAKAREQIPNISVRDTEKVVTDVGRLTVVPYWFLEDIKHNGLVSLEKAQEGELEVTELELKYLNEFWLNICSKPTKAWSLDEELNAEMSPGDKFELITRLISDAKKQGTKAEWKAHERRIKDEIIKKIRNEGMFDSPELARKFGVDQAMVESLVSHELKLFTQPMWLFDLLRNYAHPLVIRDKALVSLIRNENEKDATARFRGSLDQILPTWRFVLNRPFQANQIQVQGGMATIPRDIARVYLQQVRRRHRS